MSFYSDGNVLKSARKTVSVHDEERREEKMQLSLTLLAKWQEAVRPKMILCRSFLLAKQTSMAFNGILRLNKIKRRKHHNTPIIAK